MYLIPVAGGKLFGLTAAHLVLLAQNTTLVALALALLTGDGAAPADGLPPARTSGVRLRVDRGQMRWRDGLARLAAVAGIILLGSVAPAAEIQRAVDLKAFAISECNVLTPSHLLEPNRWLSNYFARADRMPTWVLRRDAADAPATLEDRQCWPDHPYHARNLPTTGWSEPDRW